MVESVVAGAPPTKALETEFLAKTRFLKFEQSELLEVETKQFQVHTNGRLPGIRVGSLASHSVQMDRRIPCVLFTKTLHTGWQLTSKKIELYMKTTVTLLILFTLFSPNTFAQSYVQWGLAEGAKARLGKGRTLASGNVGHTRYNILPMAHISQLLVPSVFGSAVPQPIKKSARSPCIRVLLVTLCSVWMKGRW